MADRFTTTRLLALILLAASAPASAVYAQGRRVLPAGARAVARSSVCRQGRIAGTPFVRTELFFGAGKPDGGEVSEAEWNVFLDQVVTPEFPDGLTVLTGRGQFRGSGDPAVEENSMVLILLYPLRERVQSGRKIEKIRRAYKRDFRQQAVLRVDDPTVVCVSF